MDNKFLTGYLNSIPNNERGRLSQVEKGVETAKKSAYLAGLGAGILTLGHALFQHWKSKEDDCSENRNSRRSNNFKSLRK